MSDPAPDPEHDPVVGDRSNYKRWPWASFLVIGLSIGAIFFLASAPTQLGRDQRPGTLALQIIFLIGAIVLFFPSLLVLFFLLCYCIMKALGCKPPKKIRKCFRRIFKRQKSSIHQTNRSNLTTASKSAPTKSMRPSSSSSSSSRDGISVLPGVHKSKSLLPVNPPESSDSSQRVWTTHNHRSEPGYSYPPHQPQQQQTQAVVHQPPPPRSPPTIIVQRTDSDSSGESVFEETADDVAMVTVEADPIIINVKNVSPALSKRQNTAQTKTNKRKPELNNNSLMVQAPSGRGKNHQRPKNAPKPSLKNLRERSNNYKLLSNNNNNTTEAEPHSHSTTRSRDKPRIRTRKLAVGTSSELEVEAEVEQGPKTKVKKDQIDGMGEKDNKKDLSKEDAGKLILHKRGIHPKDESLENLSPEERQKRLTARARWRMLKATTRFKALISTDTDMQNPRKGQMWRDSSGNLVLM